MKRIPDVVVLKMALWAWGIVAVVMMAAALRVMQFKSDVKVTVTLEDHIYTFPGGCQITVDRATWQTIRTCPDGTFEFIH